MKKKKIEEMLLTFDHLMLRKFVSFAVIGIGSYSRSEKRDWYQQRVAARHA